MQKVLYGGDYNPEQWSQDVWSEDMKLFEEANIDTLTVGVFSWSIIQKDENTFDFTVFDKVMELLQKKGKNICLGTGTAAHPPWLAKKYPEVTRVDFEGRKHKFGQRHNSCPNSPIYQKYSRLMAKKMAERYGHMDISAWHINNEYGGTCYCENCEKAFRVWLKQKYGSLEKLNEAWNTIFWSHYFYYWDEIVAPNALSEHYGRENVTAFQGITLDYMRFNSDSLLNNFLGEKAELKAVTPSVPVTTNFMGMFRPLDYFKWADHLDFISWDNYPPDMHSEARMALTHDLMRGLKKGKPFWLMEQTPTTTACRDINPVKRPGVMRLWSYQAIAHGSDSVLFFQMRQSKGASEKYHGAVINHASRNDTRAFKEVKKLGEELSAVGNQFISAETAAKVAFVFDWDSWWSVEISDGPTRYMNYQQTMIHYYQAFFSQNIAIDMISIDGDLEKYDVVVAPLLHMIKDDFHKKAEQFTANGGCFITTYLSGIVDENDNAILDDNPGLLKKLLGIRIDETDTSMPNERNSLVVSYGDWKGNYDCSLIYDVIQTEGADTIAEYGQDFYAGMPAVTKNKFGKGEGWYIGSQPNRQFLEKLFASILESRGISCMIQADSGVEITERKKDNYIFSFAMNHGDEEKEIIIDDASYSLLDKKIYKSGDKITIDAKDVIILRREI